MTPTQSPNMPGTLTCAMCCGAPPLGLVLRLPAAAGYSSVTIHKAKRQHLKWPPKLTPSQDKGIFRDKVSGHSCFWFQWSWCRGGPVWCSGVMVDPSALLGHSMLSIQVGAPVPW